MDENSRQHAEDFISKKRRLRAYIANDGKQTPNAWVTRYLLPSMQLQHVAEECIRKWHKMQPGKELSQVQQEYLVDVIMTWIQKEMERH